MTQNVYLLVPSDHTLPLYEACLARRPEHIVILQSEQKGVTENTERLSLLLSEALPQTQLHQVPSQGLKGDSLSDDSLWVNQVLRPFLEQPRFAGARFWLNLNGGTKSFSQILTSCLGFDYLDYRALGSNELTACSIDYRKAGQAGALQVHTNLQQTLPRVPPLDVARLYNQNAKERTSNPLTRLPQSLMLAQWLFTELSDAQSDCSKLFATLDEHWSVKRDQPSSQVARLSLPLEHLGLQSDAAIAKLSLLCPEAFFSQDGQLYFPGNAKLGASAKEFKRWLSGDWLEQLGRHWLEQTGIEQGNISGNLTVEKEQGQSASGHEADLFVHHQGKSTLIEMKADLPQGHSPTKLADEFNGNSSFGKVTRALFIGPVLRRKLQEKNATSLKIRCASNGIRLLQEKADFGQLR